MTSSLKYFQCQAAVMNDKDYLRYQWQLCNIILGVHITKHRSPTCLLLKQPALLEYVLSLSDRRQLRIPYLRVHTYF